MEPITEAERRATFDYYLRLAIFFGERHEVSCIGLSCETWRAIHAVVGEYPNVRFETVLSAREELERQLDGRQSDEAMARYRRRMERPYFLTRFANVATVPTELT